MEKQLTQDQKAYNLSNFEDEFRHYLVAVNNLKPVSVKNYLSDFRFFAGWVETESSLDTSTEHSSPADFYAQFTESFLKEYKAYLTANDLPRRTINRRLSTLRKFFSFVVSQNWIESNPVRNISNVKKSSDKGDITAKESPKTNPLVTAFMKDTDVPKKNSSRLESDIHEFFAIINSQKSHGSTIHSV